MKFVYWSGHNKPLEQALKKREKTIEDFAKSLGLNPDGIKVSYNYKDQTNKAKEKRKQPISLSEPDHPVERGTVHEYSNGTIAVRLNDRVVKSKVESKLSPLVGLSYEDYIEYAADIEVGIVATYLSNYAMEISPKYDSFSDVISDEPLEPLLPIFIASEIKMRNHNFFTGIRVVSDPYFYETVDMHIADWMDLFDICNYYRFLYRTSFVEAIEKSRKHKIDHNRALNKVITELEDLANKFYDYSKSGLKTG